MTLNDFDLTDQNAHAITINQKVVTLWRQWSAHASTNNGLLQNLLKIENQPRFWATEAEVSALYNREEYS